MKVVILAGGFGTRISELSHLKPKPMIEIGEMPILWHIMKYYSYFGFTDFIICAGYKQELIKNWFSDYFIQNSDVTFNLLDNSIEIHKKNSDNWKVTVIDTGLNTMTGGRIKKVQKYIGNERFMMTYGDGVADIDLDKLISFHKKQKSLATISVVKPEGRYGVLDIEDDIITDFREKDSGDVGYINGGFMVLEPEIFQYIVDDKTIFERQPLETISKKGLLSGYKHHGFWKCMDTYRDKVVLDKLWQDIDCPWRIWK